MKKVIMFSLLLGVMGNVFAAPTLIEASATGTTVKFATKLSEILPKGYKVKIDLNNGKGLVAMTCSKLVCSLSSNALPKNTYSSTYKIGIYDSKGVLQGTTINGNYVILSTITTGYTKISNSGTELPVTAKLGEGENDWACTKDDKTGLTWEVKTDDGGLRDKNWRYSWYQPIGDNGGSVGYTDVQNYWGVPNCSTKDNCNTDAFTNAVNAKGLCGKNDWRMPTIDELKTLVYCSDGKYDPNGYCSIDASETLSTPAASPTINSSYFPNTLDDWYWSSSPFPYLIKGAWVVDFRYSNSTSGAKDYHSFVRLVR